MICSFLRVQVSVVQPLGSLDTAEPIVVSLLADHHAADSKLMPNPPGPSSYRTPGNIGEVKFVNLQVKIKGCLNLYAMLILTLVYRS